MTENVYSWLADSSGRQSEHYGDARRDGAGPGTRSRAASSSAPVIIGVSLAMQRVRMLIDQLAPTRLAIHIYGPSGVGKELVACALHVQSRVRGQLVAFNVCSIPDSLFEATLFGHVRGAYTSAVRDNAGYIRQAAHGTLFLDEIGSLPESNQVKLLRVLETGEVRPLGADRNERTDFRLVSASNENLDELEARGTFRLDLSRRLRGAVISIPPLDTRPEDIPHLVQHHLDLQAEATGWRGTITASAIKVLVDRSWRGNVRELMQVMDCVVAISGGRDINARLIREALELQALDFVGADAEFVKGLRQLMMMADGRVDIAAKAMGVHRSTIYRQLRRAGLKPSGDLG